MDFAHYTDQPVALAVDLVNTFGWESGTESLASVDELEAFLADHAETWTDELPTPRRSDVGAVQRLRGELRRVFEAEDAATAAAAINGILSDNGATPHLSVHGGPPHLHFEPSDVSLSKWMGVVTGMGLATVLADHGIERLGICQASDCNDAYVDTSRNRSRRHCSTTCGTREHVAAHRERKRQDA